MAQISGNPCRLADCTLRAHARGYCPKHYQMWRRYGDKVWDLPAHCEACGSTENLVVDHDHNCCPTSKETKVTCTQCIRGMLCHGCNSALGYLQDSIDRCTSLIAYIATHCEISRVHPVDKGH